MKYLLESTMIFTCIICLIGCSEERNVETLSFELTSSAVLHNNLIFIGQLEERNCYDKVSGYDNYIGIAKVDKVLFGKYPKSQSHIRFTYSVYRNSDVPPMPGEHLIFISSQHISGGISCFKILIKNSVNLKEVDNWIEIKKKRKKDPTIPLPQLKQDL